MKPLPSKIEDLETLLLHHRRTLAQNTGVPFVRLVYRPGEAHECRRCRETLARTLAREHIRLETVSCRGVILAHYERRERLAQLFALEVAGRVDKQLEASIARHARRELERRLLDAVERLGDDGVIFLTDTAYVYPYLQLASVLDTCTNRINPPMALVVFYPAEVDVDGQLLFLGVRPSGYYRTRNLI